MKHHLIEREQPRRLAFLSLLIFSSCLWCYAVLTTSIDHIDLQPFPILSMVPPIYWLGVALLVVATIIWYSSPETKWYHFLLLLFWTLYIFIGPEMMEVNARGYDQTDLMWGVSMLKQGWFAKEIQYQHWPGFYFLSVSVYDVTGVGYYTLPRVLSVCFHLLRMVFAWYFASHLFQGKKEVLLFSVLFIGLLWDPQTLDPCPQHLALLMMLVLLGVCFSAGQLDMRRRALIIILFTTMVITHVLTPFIVALLFIFFSLMSLTKRHFGYSRDISGYTLVTLFSVMFVTYLMYTADWVLKDAVTSFIRILSDPALPTRLLISESQHQVFCVNLVYLFYSILLLWIFIIVNRKEFWTKLSIEKLFPFLCLIPVSFVTIPYGMAALPRLYLLGVAFIVWFLVRESRAVRKVVVTIFLVVLLAMAFGVRYSMEYTCYVPTADFAGARFVCDKIPLSDTVYTPTAHSPSPMARANRPEQPNLVSGTKPTGRYLRPDFPFATRSVHNENFIRYHSTEKDASDIIEAFYPYKGNIIYTNGDYQVYAYRYRRE